MPLRTLWVAFALATLGLGASLLPQGNFASASSGEPEGAVVIAWPAWSVQQQLGSLGGSVGAFRIWVSAGPDATRDVTVRASLLDASTGEAVRRSLLRVSRGYIPTQHTLTFPRYLVPGGQRLLLQLNVGECEKCHVVFRLANPEVEHSAVWLNGEPIAGSGPLAFQHISDGSRFRAAIAGEPDSRLRLVLAAVSAVIALLLHPRVLLRLRPVGTRARRALQSPVMRAKRIVAPAPGASDQARSSGFGRLLAVPVYPWLAGAAPILHFLASNPLHFEAVDAVVPLLVTLAVVTVGVVGARLLLKHWHRSAACAAVAIAFVFGYGHLQSAVTAMIDDRLFFGIAAVLATACGLLVVRSGAVAVRWTPFLNVLTTVLVLFPAASLVAEAVAAASQKPPTTTGGVDDLAAHLLPSGLPEVTSERPDIYYIILDSYARADALTDQFGFDNTEFVRALEDRGFYVASEATSNYTYTIQSTPSLLNMHYLDSLGHRVPGSHHQLLDIARFHATGAVLRSLGYSYIHLDSGVLSTELAPQADRVVSFTPSGPLVRATTGSISSPDAAAAHPLLSSRFIRRLVQTTALRPVLGRQFLLGDTEPYPWWSPHRALQMFDFLSTPIEADSPKFVLAHIVKPHDPATFDKDGNYIDDDQGFDNYHDASVPSAYIGQLIYINKLVLDMVDSILRSSPNPPIIVLAGDHGHGDDSTYRHAILSAFHFPSGGNAELYPTISSVNHFRYILDFYFNYNLGLLEDRLFWYPSDRFDFRT